MNLADALVPKHFDDGDQIIKQGDNADGMYFVEQGVVRITILGEGGREVEVSFGNDSTQFSSLGTCTKYLRSVYMSYITENCLFR